jgi:hypothetical protein
MLRFWLETAAGTMESAGKTGSTEPPDVIDDGRCRAMTSEPHLSFGQRVYRALFKVFGPADVGPTGPPATTNPDRQDGARRLPP